MDRNEEIIEKKRRVRRMMEAHGLRALYLKTQCNFSWLTAGRLNLVGIAMELGAAGILITPEREYVVCNNIEAPRIADEEKLEEQGYEIHSYPWHSDRERDTVERLAGGAEGIGADFGFPGARNVTADVARLRFSLLSPEIERYKELGRRASLALEQTAATVRPGDKECEVIGRLADRLWSDRLDYITTFCAADERIARYRHPIPTETAIRTRAMVCVNARKWGLIVSLTRFVQFEPVSEELRRIYNANVEIDCTFMANTIPGRPVVEAFRRGAERYRELGFADEFELHHQGGAMGYVGRDYRANFQTQEIVEENQAFSWNPSITGSKSEDVMLATSGGPLMLTRPAFFPVLTMEVDGHVFTRPDILVVS